MRITIVISSLKGGGAERVAMNLANAWAEEGRAVTVLTTSQRGAPASCPPHPRVACRDLGWPRVLHEDDLTTESVAAVLRGLQRTGCTDLISQTLLLASLRDAILATAPEVVVAHIDVTNIRVIAAMCETGVPVIACEHTDAERVSMGAWQHARDALYPRAHAVVAPHASIAQWLARRGAPAVAIANPLAAPERGRPGRRIAGRPAPPRTRLVSLTRLSREKRVDLLLHAFARVAADLPHWDLDIYGDGPLRTSLATLAQEVAPRDRIHFHGFTSDPYAVLRDAALFASSSAVEGFGNAIWEALACGVPVVAVDCGAPVRSLVRHGIDGLLVAHSTVTEFASALRSLMANDVLRQRFASRAPEILTRLPMAAALEAWDALLGAAVPRSEAALAR